MIIAPPVYTHSSNPLNLKVQAPGLFLSVGAKTRFGVTPLDWAIKQLHPETAELLRTHGGHSTSILVAARVGDLAGVEALLNAGAEVNAKDGNGWTPLHIAAFEGHTEIVELLIDKGADVNMKNIVGYTPLDWAVGEDNTELAALLRKHGGKTGEELKAEGK